MNPDLRLETGDEITLSKQDLAKESPVGHEQLS